MSHHDPEKYLYDINESARIILMFVAGKTLNDYSSDIMLKSAVERHFEIIGEALKQLIDQYPDYKSKISDASRIISFRNRLIHGYFSISDEVVWGVIESSLPLLKSEIEILLIK